VEQPGLDPRRVASASRLLSSGEPVLRRTARRISLCADDAEDAFQRSVEILITKAPPIDGAALMAWMRVVTRREALAVRRSRERLLGTAGSGVASFEEGPPAAPDSLPSDAVGPAEWCERRERFVHAARLLRVLKPHERRAIILQARGYSYAEICAITGWTYTKVNRCLAEGRARLYRLAAASGLRS
jgi:DNA-directed RNA polymerase specialized sigma24 family protein